MELIDTNKSLLENLNFLSGPIIAVLGLFVFYQVRLAKKTIKLAEDQVREAKNHLRTISKRESASLAASQVEIFIERIIPLGEKLYEKEVEVGFPKFKGAIKDFLNDELPDWDKDYLKEYNLKFSALDLSIYQNLKFINSLEGFATYFTKGVADEEIAFGSIALVYCGYVEKYYPLIAGLRNKENPNRHYNNLVELYKLWSSRLEKFKVDFEIESRQQAIELQINELEKFKGKPSQVSKGITPIGLE